MNDHYPLKPFRIHDPSTLCEVMRQWPLATLISGAVGSASITLLPLIIEENTAGQIRLFGHLDINNEHAESIEPGAAVSFQFKGPDAYASPDLYPDPRLPGWLYVSVQGDGEIESLLNDDELSQLLCRSTSVFGSENQTFQLSEDDKRIGQFIGGIKGFVIKVTRISGIAKLAQDKGHDLAHIATDFLLGTTDRSGEELLERLLEETLAK